MEMMVRAKAMGCSVAEVAYELGRSRSMERYGRTEGGLNNVQAQYVLRALIVETANARSWIPWV